MMSTRRSLLVTGVLTAALSVVGFVGDVAAQPTLTVVASPITIEEPASASSTAPYTTVTITYKSGGATIPNGGAMATLSWGGIATRRKVAAAAGDDYNVTVMPPSQAGVSSISEDGVTFDASTTTGTAMVTYRVTALHDDLPEGDEQFNVAAEINGGPQNVAVITLTDNDNPGVSTLTTKVNKNVLKEIDAKDTTKGVVELTVSTTAGQTFTTDQRIQLELGGDATKGDDYTIDKEVLTLDAGMTMVKAKITVVDDMVYDGRVNETVNVTAYVDSVRLPGGTNGTHTIQIEDNDQNPEDFEVSVDSEMIMEGEVATLTVTAMEDVSSARTFMLTLAGTAMENSDYTIDSELTIPKDTKTGSVQLRAVTDAVAEMDETVMITVMAGGVMIGTVQTVTITGDPDAPTIPTPTPALPIFGAFALGAGLFAAGRARLRGRQALRAGRTRGQLTR
jgi:hypothetical protein